MYVHPLGQALKHQTGISRDELVSGLRGLVEAVHQEGGRIVLQLAHSGRQSHRTIIGQTPIAPSAVTRDPVYFFKPRAMTREDIQEVIQSFGQAARRAVEAGADGIQLHAAHGYLINEFLSPFFNRRQDEWGGSDENRFRFLKEIFLTVKQVTPEGMPILVKLNTHDHTPKPGVTPPLAARYARWLAELGIDGLEVSCGSTVFSPMNLCRGEVPVEDFIRPLPWWQKPLGRLMLKQWVGRYDLEEGYNLEAAKMIKPVIDNMPLLLVGGLRSKARMEEILENKRADLISMSRPFIREPFIVKKFKEKQAETVACVSCNKCAAAVVMSGMPIRCYQKGLPPKKK
jgi:2,4-dienoyl-CoA reductase-like NADH-dependent reductase (Old Yellow Enzyme family)